MAVLVHYVTPLICFLFFRHIYKSPAAWLFLEGLRIFLPSTAEIKAPPADLNKLSKRERKLLAKRQLQLKGAAGQQAQQQLIMQQLSRTGLQCLYNEPRTFGGDFEAIGVLLLIIGVALVVHCVMAPLFGVRHETLILGVGMVLIGYVAVTALRTELNPDASLMAQIGSKLHLLVLFGAGTAAAAAVLQVAARRWVSFDPVTAAADFDKVLMAIAQQRKLKMDSVALHPTHLSIVLSLVAGFLAAALWAPASRAAKLFVQASPVPWWGEQYLAPGALPLRAMQLAMALPLLVVVVQLPHMMAIWGLDAAQRALAARVLLALAALAQLAVVRPLVQCHLNGGLLEWHMLRHDGTSAPAKARIVEKRLIFVYATTCKAALQLLTPAALLVSLAAAHLAADGTLSSWLPSPALALQLLAKKGTEAASEAAVTAAAAAVPAPAAAAGAQVPLQFFAFLCSFLGWWTCAVFCVFAYPMILVYRTGLNAGS